MDEKPIETEASSSSSNAEFQHKPVENVSTEAYCSVQPKAEAPKKPSNSADKILQSALDPKAIKMALRPVSRLDLNSTSEQARPSDFGEHEPIPDDAVTMTSVATGGDQDE